MKENQCDWNVWFPRMYEALQAFQIDDLVRVCQELNISIYEDGDCINVGGGVISQTLIEIMRHLVETNDEDFKKNQIAKQYNCYIECKERVVEYNHFHDNVENRHLQPRLVVKLRNTLDYAKDPYFSIDFIMASQIF